MRATRVARGEAKAAILVRPTRLEQLAAVASAGDVMPQKSTYFYPKLLTGMVFNPLEDDEQRWSRRSSATRSTSSPRGSTSRRSSPSDAAASHRCCWCTAP